MRRGIWKLQHGSGGDGNNVANKAKDLLSENNTLTQKIQDMEMERKRSKEKEILLEKKQAALRNGKQSLVKQNGGTSKSRHLGNTSESITLLYGPEFIRGTALSDDAVSIRMRTDRSVTFTNILAIQATHFQISTNGSLQ